MISDSLMKMLLKTSIVTAMFAVTISGCSTDLTTPSIHEGSVNKPNILFILVDDMGWNDVSYNGSEIQTPNIDALAASGVILDRAYAYPICSPTRAALMTGQNPIKFGIDGPMENDAQLPGNLKLLPEYLKDDGYETLMVGKWHLGMSEVNAMPYNRGFDYFYGQLGGFLDYYTRVYFGRLDWQRNGKTVREDGYATHLQADDAIRLITEHDDDVPFFMYLSLNAPHTPLHYPPNATDAYDGIQDSDRRIYAQMVTDLDNTVGRVVEAVDERGIRNKTLIVFISDNGGNIHAGASNSPLRGSKGGVYEGSVRVPAFVSWTSHLPSGQKSKQPVFVQDWMPTLLQAVQANSVKNIEGQSVWKNLEAGTVNEDVPTVILGTSRGKAVYDWPFKYVHIPGSTAIHEVYNVVEDPTEKIDLSLDMPEFVSSSTKLLSALPIAPSKAARGPSPEEIFQDENGNFVYDRTLEETAEPWADIAIGASPPSTAK